MGTSKILKTSQEQAVASWIDNLNQLRLDAFFESLKAQDVNFFGALNVLEKFKEDVFFEVVDRNRGGLKGMHGFIAERAQVSIDNARKINVGAKPEYFLVDNNGPIDYLRGNTPIQQKFVQKDFGLGAIKDHSIKYPDYLKSGGKYQIPKNYFEKIQKIMSISPEDAEKLTRNSEPSIDQWRNVNKLVNEIGLTSQNGSLEPTLIDYQEVQLGTYEETADKEITSLKKTDQERRNEAYQKSKPTLQEGAKVAATSAVIEGGMVFCLGVYEKLKSGKKLWAFTSDDWKDLGLDTAAGGGKGAIRGAGIYALTNFTQTPAAVASSLVTASFGIVAQARLLKEGKISNEDFLINSEVVCLDVSVSAISSLMGQVLLPIPVLGAVIGNAVGMFMYGIAKENLSKEEQALIANFNSSIGELNKQLDKQYREFIELLNLEFAKFNSVLDLAFDLNVNKAFAGSIEMAQFVGCDHDKVLWNKQDVDAYFQN